HVVTLGYEYLDSQTTVRQPPSVIFGGAFGDSTTTGHQVTASFSRDLTKILTAGISAAFAFRAQRPVGGQIDYTRSKLSLFGNYVLTDKLVVRGNVGVAQLDTDFAKARTIVTTDTDIAYHAGPAVFGLRLERGFSETFTGGQNLGVVETT